MRKVFQTSYNKIGAGQPCYIIAEISCNHEGNKDEAKRIIEEAEKAGANAVKIQTYTPDTMTRDFKTKPVGTIWQNTDLYSLYQKAQTPWDWSKDLKACANNLGLDFFSSPFDETAVDFLVNDLGVDLLKVASFEIVDLKLLEKMAKTGLPIIMSNGMTNFLELDEAVRTVRTHGCKNLAILHCNSGYPAAFSEANLKTIPVIENYFDVTAGLSDHTLFYDHNNYSDAMAHITPLEAVKLGAKIIEVHLMTDRKLARSLFETGEGGFDWPFSREPNELSYMIKLIRQFESEGVHTYSTEKEQKIARATHGYVCFEPTEKEMASRQARPSLWVIEDIKRGEIFNFCGGKRGNIDSIRPAGGLHIRYADFIHGKSARRDLKAGEPLNWDMIDT